MNFGELNQLVLTWLDDPDGTYFTPAIVHTWLNNAQREVQKQLIQAGENYYVQKVSTTLTQNEDTYALPTNFLKVNKFELVTAGTGVNETRQMIGFVTLVQLDEVSMSTGMPSAYNIKKNCITVRPIPDNTYKVYLQYSHRVGNMTLDTDLPDVPESYQEYIAILAGLDGFIRDGRDMGQLLEKKRYYLEMMKQDAQDRNVDSPRQVIMTDTLGYGVLF